MPSARLPMILAGVLGLQLVLVLLGALGSDDLGVTTGGEPLVELTPAEVDQIVISDAEKSITLYRESGESGQRERFRVAEAEGFPASQTEVERLLERIAELRPGFPVARTSGAAERFKVADDAFERRVVLRRDGSDLVELLVGTSPGLRQSHVRVDGSDDIYVAELPTFELSPASEDWVDTEALYRDPAKLAGVDVGDAISLRRVEGAWQLSDLPEGQTTDAAQARSLVDKVARIRIDAVLGKIALSEYRQNEPTLRIALAPVEGAPIELVVSQVEGETDYVLKASDLEHYVRVTSAAVGAIQSATRSALSKTVEPDSAADAPDAGTSEAASAGMDETTDDGATVDAPTSADEPPAAQP